MEWFNLYGLIIVTAIMIPNIVFAVMHKEGFENTWQNKKVEVFEQIGRYGCFALMIFNIPYVSFGFASNLAFLLYLIINITLTIIYCVIWIFWFNKNNLFRSLSLSVIPSAIFLFSGIISRYILLIVTACIFAPCHILISVKNLSKR